MKRITALFIILTIFLLPVFGEGQKEDQGNQSFTLKYAGVLPYDHPTSRAIESWAQEVEARSSGRIKIQLFHGGALGKSTEVVEYIQSGDVAFSNVSTAFMSSFDKKYDVFSLPYVFRDEEHMEAALTSDFGDYMKNLLVDEGIRGLAFLDSGSRSVYTKGTAVQAPADMDGVKIRVMSSVAVNSMNALGANGVPIPWGELYTALQTGVVDAAENNPPSVIAGKHYEVCKYYSLTHHFRTPDLFIMSESSYSELPEDLQKILTASIEEYLIPTQYEAFAASTQQSLEELEQLGMEIYQIDNLIPFIEATAQVRNSVAKEIGMAEWIEKISDL